MNLKTLATALALSFLALTSCMTPKGDTPKEQMATAHAMRAEVVDRIEPRNPSIKAEIQRNPGYVVWEATAAHLGLAAMVGGYMVVTETSTGKVNYRKFFRFGIGPGIAFKGFYGLAVVKSRRALDQLMSDSTFNFGAGAEASFVFGSFGGTAEAQATFSDDFEVYLMTHTGVSLELLLDAIWTWPNDELNIAATTGT
jgi:hypothetical protein